VIVAAPVLGRRLRIVGRGREVAYGDDDGFVVVLGLGPPVLPNGLQVGRLPSVGDEFVVGPGRVWDPTLRVVGAVDLVADGPEDLVRAVESRDPSLAAVVGARLIGRGGGLTPEGDDLLAGVAAVVASLPWPLALREAWLGALVGDDLRARTTALSATLLELAVGGMGPEPLQSLLAGDADALSRLEALGHSTGRAIAAGAAVGLSMGRMDPQTTPGRVV
jgi:Protein of unknown function (DUF2877)